MKLNDIIELKNSSHLCSIFPLPEFKNYSLEKRDNNIKIGKVINAMPFYPGSGMHSLLIKDQETGCVCVYRTYNNEYREN